MLAAWWLVVALGRGLAPSGGDAYRDHELVQVFVADDDALARLLATGVDPWTDHPRPGWLTVRVTPSRRAAVWADQWPLKVLDHDLGQRVDDESARLAARPDVAEGGDFFADFRTLDEIDAWVDALAAAHPELVSIEQVATSIEGRSVRALRITAAGSDDRPSVLVTAGQHAREWISVSSALWLADTFVSHADDPAYAAALDAGQLVIVPVVNPDGYLYTWTDERFWRKNRRDGVGVDTNRNWAHGWGGEGASGNPSDENYRGAAAFSEPETQGLSNWIGEHPELVSHVDLHSFGQLVLYPWGDVADAAPDDDELSSTADAIVTAMSGAVQYIALQGVQLYPAAGNAIDWTYGDAGLEAYTFELRPDFNNDAEGFAPAPDQIAPVGDEVLAGIWVVLDAALEQGAADTTGGGADSGGGSSSTGGPQPGSSSGATGDGSTSTTTTDAPGDGTTVAADGTGAASESTGAPTQDGDASGCSCRTRAGIDPRGGWSWCLLVAAVIGRRRARA